jgi:hypothetical protein
MGLQWRLRWENDRHRDNYYNLQWAECGADEPMARVLSPDDARHPFIQD